MFSSLLITFREGLEAALIVVIVVSFLVRAGETRLVRYAWAGVAGALSLSLAAGSALFAFTGELGEEVAEIFEVGGTFLALAVLTYMIIWMRNHGPGLKGSLEQKTRQAAHSTTPIAITLLAFAAIGREGLETVLFLFAGAASSGALPTAAGAVAGLSLALLAGLALYRGSSRLDLRKFFTVTGILLIFFGAGILSYALHEIGEMGLLPGGLEDPLWNTGWLLSHKEGLGAVLRSTLGYYATPSLIQLVACWSYLGIMLWLFFRVATVRQVEPAGQRY